MSFVRKGLFAKLALVLPSLLLVATAHGDNCRLTGLRAVKARLIGNRTIAQTTLDMGNRSMREVRSIIQDAVRNFGYSTRARTLPGRVARGAFQIATHPVMMPQNLIEIAVDEVTSGSGLRAIWRVPIQHLRENGVPTTITLGFYLFGPRLLLLDETFIDETDDEFLAESQNGQIVIVDLGPEDEQSFAMSAQALRQRYHGRRVTVIHSNSLDEMNESLMRLSERSPIAALQISAHGAPGLFTFPNHSVLNSDTIRGAHTRIRFAAGATIRMSSCFTGLGEQGEEFMKALGNYYLGHGGGRVIATERLLLVPRAAFQATPPARALQGLIYDSPAVTLGTSLVYHFGMDTDLSEMTRSHDIRRVDISAQP